MANTIRMLWESTACSMGVRGSIPLRITSSSYNTAWYGIKRYGIKRYGMKRYGINIYTVLSIVHNVTVRKGVCVVVTMMADHDRP